MADSQLKIILALKDEATKKLQGFKKTLGSFQKQTASGFDTAKKGLSAIRKPALVATAALTGVAVAGFKLAEGAGKYESIRDAFQSMTDGMGVGVEEFEKNVAEASAGTLDKLTILQGGTRALSLMGKETFSDFGSQFAQMAELSKKAARATGMDVTYMFDSLITGMSRESKMILDNLGITVDLTKAKEDYAATLGKSADELTIAEEKTAVLNHTLGKLEENYGNVAVSSGGMAGAMSKLKVTIADAKLEIGLALIPVFNDLVRTITPLIKEHVPKLIDGLKKAVEWFKNLSPTGRKILLLFLALAPAIVAISTVLMPVLSVLQVLIPVLMTLGGVIAGLTAPIWLVIAAITAIIAVGVWWAKNWQENIDTIKWAWEMFVDFIYGIWENIKNIFNNAVNWIIDNTIGRLLKEVERVKNALISIKDKASGVVSSVSEKVGGAWGSAKGFLGFQEGGVVPGRIGEPVPALVHGGETIIPAGRSLGTVNVYVQGGNYLDREAGEMFAKMLGEQLRRELRF